MKQNENNKKNSFFFMIKRNCSQINGIKRKYGVA